MDAHLLLVHCSLEAKTTHRKAEHENYLKGLKLPLTSHFHPMYKILSNRTK